MNNCDFLIFDVSSMLYRSFYGATKNYHPNALQFADEEESDKDMEMAGYVFTSALYTFNALYQKFKPKYATVMAMDEPSWRIDYTKSDMCISGLLYKGTRRKNQTPEQVVMYKMFKEHRNLFENILVNHTGLLCLKGNLMEADDLMAGFVQQHKGAKMVVVSGDSDLLQLAVQPNVMVYDPLQKKPQSLEPYDNDAEFYLFQKFIRGDLGSDNIPSAFPRVRMTRIKKAYQDPYEFTQMMKTTWRNQNDKEFLVEDLFEENKMLIDLREQPDMIRKLMATTINKAINNRNKFSYFDFLREVGKFQLKRVIDNIDTFVPLLSDSR